MKSDLDVILELVRLRFETGEHFDEYVRMSANARTAMRDALPEIFPLKTGDIEAAFTDDSGAKPLDIGPSEDA